MSLIDLIFLSSRGEFFPEGPAFCLPNRNPLQDVGHVAWKALYDIKVFRAEVAVESALRGGKPQDAIIRVGYSLRVVHGVSLPPYHLFIDPVLQHFHGAEKHNSSEKSPVTKVNAGFRIVLILPCTHGGGVGGEIEYLDALPFPGR